MQQLVKVTHQTTNYSVLQKFDVWELFIIEERLVNTFVMLLQTLYYFANIKLRTLRISKPATLIWKEYIKTPSSRIIKNTRSWISTPSPLITEAETWSSQKARVLTSTHRYHCLTVNQIKGSIHCCPFSLELILSCSHTVDYRHYLIYKISLIMHCCMPKNTWKGQGRNTINHIER